MVSTKGFKKGDMVKHESTYKIYEVIDVEKLVQSGFLNTSSNILKLKDKETGDVISANEARFDKVDGGYMAEGGEVKVGDILTATTGVKVKVVEYDPKFGGRVRVERIDEYATGKPSPFMPLTRFKMADGGMMAKNEDIHEKVLDYLSKHKFYISPFGEKGNSIKINDKDFSIKDQIAIEKINSKIIVSGSSNSPIWYIHMPNNMADGGMMADGGSVAKGNYEMLMSQAKEVMHHAEELMQVVKPNMDIEAWVVSKAERATTDLSDITHYLDGKKMAMGGMVKANSHKVNA